MKSILDQFAPDAINAPETVTGGSGRRTRGRTRTRTRRHTRTRTRTRRHHTRGS